MTNPGAVISGLILPSRVGPRLLNAAEIPIVVSGWPLGYCFVLNDPTVITFSAFPGSVTVPVMDASVNAPSERSM